MVLGASSFGRALASRDRKDLVLLDNGVIILAHSLD
jgi:hypothetical protein